MSGPVLTLFLVSLHGPYFRVVLTFGWSLQSCIYRKCTKHYSKLRDQYKYTRHLYQLGSIELAILACVVELFNTLQPSFLHKSDEFHPTGWHALQSKGMSEVYAAQGEFLDITLVTLRRIPGQRISTSVICLNEKKHRGISHSFSQNDAFHKPAVRRIETKRTITDIISVSEVPSVSVR